MEQLPLKLMCAMEMNDIEVLIEQKENKISSVKIKGPYIITEQKNFNGRTYKKSVMEESVSIYTTNLIKNNRSVGELNHPQSAEVNFDRACHLLTELKQDNNVWLGESSVLLGTPKGDLLAGLVRNNVKIGMSSRGVGSQKNGEVIKYKLIAVDAIHDPSGDGCFVDGILESKNYMINAHGEVIEMLYEDLEKKLENIPTSSEDKRKHILAAIKSFVDTI
jgi:hypothetical protein